MKKNTHEPVNDTAKEVGELIFNLRKELDLTQTELATAALKPQSQINRIENGLINTSVYQLREIVESTGKRLEIKIVD